jgi:hypothetical protein
MVHVILGHSSKFFEPTAKNNKQIFLVKILLILEEMPSKVLLVIVLPTKKVGHPWSSG